MPNEHLQYRVEKTDEYPTRYKAFDNPRVVWEQTTIDSKHSGGFEFAVYSNPMTNAHYSHIEDGIYASIVAYQNIDYLVDCNATCPDRFRQQTGVSKRYPTYELAKQAMLTWILQTEYWLKGQPKDQPA